MTSEEAPASITPRGVPASWLAGALLGLVAVGDLLLPAFLGLSPWLIAPIVLIGAGGIGLIVARCETSFERVPPRTIATCLVAAVVLLVLGGEGRFLYAPADWQVRDAVLADLGNHRWPFVYLTPGGPALLRAPLGMYLLPSLAGGHTQRALDLALLAQNSAVLGLMLSLGSMLFANTAARRSAGIVFALFSGMDVIGTLIVRGLGQTASFYHMENWAYGLQYSATLTQLFWAPQHALAGWGCALGFLLWQQGRLRIGTAAAMVPLFAFWSPLAAMGAVPFVAYAGFRSLKSLRRADVAIPLLASAIAMPALLYEHAGAAAVESGLHSVDPLLYCISLLLEVAPFALPALLVRTRFGAVPIRMAVAGLVLAPLWHVGTWADFQMRATIVPLCILAAATADIMAQANRPILRRYLLAILTIGSATTLSELFPVLAMRASPPPLCSLPSALNQQTGLIAPEATYLAPAAALPVRAREIVDPRSDPSHCWSRRWITPRIQ